MAICPLEREASNSSLNVSEAAEEEKQAMRKEKEEPAMTTSAPNTAAAVVVTNVISSEPEMTPPAPKRRVNGRTEGGIVRLNVGGKKFLTSWETIMHPGNCMLASMFKGTFTYAADEEGFAFIDRDGERFRHVLNFLRCSSLPSFGEAWRYEEIMEEADFFAIDELRELCQRQIEALEEAKRKERAKSFACRVTIVEPAGDGRGVAGAGGVSAARERYGTGYFTLDEDF